MEILDLKGSQEFSPDRHVYKFLAETPHCSISVGGGEPRQTSPIHSHPGADEIYYVLSGRGSMTLDGHTVEITPGTAVLTRTRSSHSLKQVGDQDLVILINYEVEPKPLAAR